MFIMLYRNDWGKELTISLKYGPILQLTIHPEDIYQVYDIDRVDKMSQRMIYRWVANLGGLAVST